MPQKIIWMYWHQGFMDSPELIKMCFTSWKIRNPEYELRFLDHESVHKYIDIPSYIDIMRKDIPIQKYANHIRLNLLNKYGGIWVDANIYCFVPLDHWLNANLMKQGIFMFTNSFQDRLIANWFIASEPNNYITAKWLSRYDEYFQYNNVTNSYTTIGRKLRRKIRRHYSNSIEKTSIWFSFLIRKILRLSPYLIMHYLFNLLYLRDEKFNGIWDRVPRLFSCDYDVRCRIRLQHSYSDFEVSYHQGKAHMLKTTHKLNQNSEEYIKYFNLINNDYLKLIASVDH